MEHEQQVDDHSNNNNKNKYYHSSELSSSSNSSSSSSHGASDELRALEMQVQPFAQQLSTRECQQQQQRRMHQAMRLSCLPCIMPTWLLGILMLLLFCPWPIFVLAIVLIILYYSCTSEPTPPRALFSALWEDNPDLDGANKTTVNCMAGARWNTDNFRFGQTPAFTCEEIKPSLIESVCIDSKPEADKSSRQRNDYSPIAVADTGKNKSIPGGSDDVEGTQSNHGGIHSYDEETQSSVNPQNPTTSAIPTVVTSQLTNAILSLDDHKAAGDGDERKEDEHYTHLADVTIIQDRPLVTEIAIETNDGTLVFSPPMASNNTNTGGSGAGSVSSSASRPQRLLTTTSLLLMLDESCTKLSISSTAGVHVPAPEASSPASPMARDPSFTLAPHAEITTHATTVQSGSMGRQHISEVGQGMPPIPGPHGKLRSGSQAGMSHPQHQQQQQQYDSMGNASGNVSAAWQNDKDVEYRRAMIHNILKLLKEDEEGSPESMERMLQMAKQLEISLYRNARSFDAYMDLSTLKQRLQQISKKGSRKRSSNSSASPDTGFSSPGQNRNDAKMKVRIPNKQQRLLQKETTYPIPSRSGPSSSSRSDSKWQKIRHKQQRLLLMQHASRCQYEAGECTVTRHCASMKKLWEHIAHCKNQQCTVQHCLSSRYILSHYRRCKDARCPACAPVRDTIRKPSERENSRESQGIPSFDNDRSPDPPLSSASLNDISMWDPLPPLLDESQSVSRFTPVMNTTLERKRKRVEK